MKSKSIIASLLLSMAIAAPSLSAVASSNASNGSTTSNTVETVMPAASNTSNAAEDAEKIVLVAINDFHGNLEEDKSEKGKNPGIAKIAGAINELKEKFGKDSVHFFSVGDHYQGTAISNLTKGESLNNILKAMNIEASAIGNHEYDWGVENMTKWQTEGNFPFLASNIEYKADNKPVEYAKPYIIKEYTLKNGKTVKIGFVGIATPETATKTLPEVVKDINFTDPVTAANKWAQKLKEEDKVDAVVALTHLGVMIDKNTKEASGEGIEFAKNVKNIDLIFTGHTHQTVDVDVNGIPVLSGYYNGRTLSIGELSFDKEGKFTKADGYLDEIYMRKNDITPDPQIEQMVADAKKELAPILEEVIGDNKQELLHGPEGDRQVTEMGQWSAKTLAELGGTQIGYINGGGIRTDLNAGPITMEEMYAIFPFDNTLVTMDVTGAQLKSIIQHGLYPADFRPGQFYGVNVEFDPATKQITKMTLLDGTEVTDAATYTMTTLDFLATGGDGYVMMKEAANMKDTFRPVRDILVENIKKNGGITFQFQQNLFPAGNGASSNTSNTSNTSNSSQAN